MKDENVNLGFHLLLLTYGIIYQVLILHKFLNISEILSATVVTTISLVALHRYHFRKDVKTDLKSNILKKVIVLIILYFLLSYLGGLVFGFQKNAYSMRIMSIINNIVMPIVIIISEEVYRYIILNSSNKRMNTIGVTLTLILLEIMISIRFSSLLSIGSAFKAVTVTILPIISKNIMLTYLAKYGGLKGTLLYRLTLDTYVYFVPILPNFSDYMKSMIGLCFPILVYIWASNCVDDYRKLKSRSNPDSRLIQLFNVPIVLLFFSFIFLISGYFSYTIVGIASNSMHPTITKGDAVIVRKVSDIKDLKIGDIIAYQNNKKQIIVHRIVEIHDGVIKTKGDANRSVDKQDIKLGEVRGKVKLNLKYIGLPSVYFNELKNKE